MGAMFKQSVVDLLTPWNAGWSRLFDDVKEVCKGNNRCQSQLGSQLTRYNTLFLNLNGFRQGLTKATPSGPEYLGIGEHSALS
jgi:hypothetical protein